MQIFDIFTQLGSICAGRAADELPLLADTVEEVGLGLLMASALRRPSRSPEAHARAGVSVGTSLASLRRFWAVAARWNSSLAPFGPRSLRRSSFRMRLRCANSISTFFRCRREVTYSFVAAMSLAISRAPSWIERGILRAGVLGQHCGLSEQASQSSLLAR